MEILILLVLVAAIKAMYWINKAHKSNLPDDHRKCLTVLISGGIIVFPIMSISMFNPNEFLHKFALASFIAWMGTYLFFELKKEFKPS